MAEFSYDVFALPISGHYDCGYGYGLIKYEQPQQHISRPSSPVRTRNTTYESTRARQLSISRPRSPPTVLPNSFMAAQSSGPHHRGLAALVAQSAIPDNEVQVSPHPTQSKPWVDTGSPRRIPYAQEWGSDSDLSIQSTRSRQLSTTQSVETASSSVYSGSYDTSIEPDLLPSHSNPQYLSLTQSEAFSGPPPIQPMRLCRREIRDSYSGRVLFQLSEGTELKLSRQTIYQVYEPESSSIIGTLGYPTDSQDEVVVILRGQDIVMRKESHSAHRWCFRPSSLTKKGACWYWYKDRLRGDIILCDAKKGGMVIARIQRDILCFERAGLSADLVNEICFSAMALAELARRGAPYDDASSLAAAIAAIALGEAAETKHSDSTLEKCAQPMRRLTITLR